MRGLLTGENNHENRTSIYKLSPAVQLIIRQPIGRLKLKRATAVTANTDCGGRGGKWERKCEEGTECIVANIRLKRKSSNGGAGRCDTHCWHIHDLYPQMNSSTRGQHKRSFIFGCERRHTCDVLHLQCTHTVSFTCIALRWETHTPALSRRAPEAGFDLALGVETNLLTV